MSSSSFANVDAAKFTFGDALTPCKNAPNMNICFINYGDMKGTDCMWQLPISRTPFGWESFEGTPDPAARFWKIQYTFNTDTDEGDQILKKFIEFDEHVLATAKQNGARWFGEGATDSYIESRFSPCVKYSKDKFGQVNSSYKPRLALRAYRQGPRTVNITRLVKSNGKYEQFDGTFDDIKPGSTICAYIAPVMLSDTSKHFGVVWSVVKLGCIVQETNVADVSFKLDMPIETGTEKRPRDEGEADLMPDDEEPETKQQKTEAEFEAEDSGLHVFA